MRLAFCVFVLGLLVLVAEVVAGCMAAMGDASEVHDPVIPAGARVAGLDVGGRTLSQAAALIESEFAVRMRSPIHVRVAGHRRTLTARSVQLQFDPLRSARRANIAARRARARASPVDVDVQPWVRWDRSRLGRFVRRIGELVARAPRNARLPLAVTKLRIRRGRVGYDIDRRRLRAALERACSMPFPEPAFGCLIGVVGDGLTAT